MRVRDEQPVYMLRLTRAELEAASWCVNTLSSAWLGAPDGTAIHGLKDKLLDAQRGDFAPGRTMLAKAGDITG